MPVEGPRPPVCPLTGITVPECSCIQCLTEQLRRFQPGLLEADPAGEVRVTRAPNRRESPRRDRRAA